MPIRANAMLGQLPVKPVCQVCQAQQLVPRTHSHKKPLFRCSRRRHCFYTDHAYLATADFTGASSAAEGGPQGEAEPHRRRLECE